jgi:hypothetical protein
VVATGVRPQLAPEQKPYRPIGAVLEMFRAREREVVVEGPADTGKSRGCIEKVHACCEKYPGSRWAFVRKTRKSLTNTACVTYERWVRPDGASHLWGDQEYRYPNGSKIYLLGMDDPDKVQSMELDGAFFQQAEESEIDDWEILSKCVTGRGATMPYVQLLADMNPTYPDFHLYKRETDGKVRFIQVRHEDNPSITPERIAALDSLTGHRYKRLRLGLRVAAEGMFFTEWNPEVHLCDPFPIPTHWTRWITVDYGFADPFACYWLARSPDADRRIYVYREVYATGLRDEQQAELVRKRSEGEQFQQPRQPRPSGSVIALAIGDPSMFNKRTEQDKPSIASVYQHKGIPLVAGTNNRISGWQVVRRALAGDVPRLQVFRGRCPNLERTLPAMVHDPLDAEDLADKVNGSKTEDHAVDALRYGLVAEASPPKAETRSVTFAGG